MIYENSNQLIKDIEKCIQEASKKNPFEYLDQAKQIRKESEEKMRKIIQTKRDEIIGIKAYMYIKFITDIDPYILELKNESGNLELEESTITKTYNAVNEEYAQNETELKRQEALQAIEIAEIDQLKEEIRLMELELNELEGPETSLAAVPPNEYAVLILIGILIKH